MLLFYKKPTAQQMYSATVVVGTIHKFSYLLTLTNAHIIQGGEVSRDVPPNWAPAVGQFSFLSLLWMA